MRIKDHTDMVRHLTDSFNIPEARRMIAENPALTQEQFKAGGIVQPGVEYYGKFGPKEIAEFKTMRAAGATGEQIKKKLGISIPHQNVLKQKYKLPEISAQSKIQTTLNKIPIGSSISAVKVAKEAGLKDPQDVRQHPLIEKRKLKLVYQAGVDFDYETFLDDGDFKQLFKDNPMSDKEFAKFLKDNDHTTISGKEWTTDSVRERRGVLKLQSPKTIINTPEAIKNYAKENMPDLYKQYKAGKINLESLKSKVQTKRYYIKEKGSMSAKEYADYLAKRRKYHADIPEEKKAEIKERRQILQAEEAAKVGRKPPPRLKHWTKDTIWTDLVETARKNQGKVLNDTDMTTRYKNPQQIKGKWGNIDDTLKIKLVDNATGTTLTYDNFEKFIDTNKPGGMTFKEMGNQYEIRKFINDNPKVKYALQDVIWPGTAPEGAKVPGHIHHLAGRATNAYKVAFAPASANMAERDLKRTFNAMWNQSQKIKGTNPSKAFEFQMKAVRDYKKGIEELGNIQGQLGKKVVYGQKMDPKKWMLSNVKDQSLRKVIRSLDSVGKDIRKWDTPTLVLYGKKMGCIKRADGTDIASCLQKKLQTQPEKFAEVSSSLAKSKNAKTAKNSFNVARKLMTVSKLTGWGLVGEAVFAPLIALPMWAKGTPKDEIVDMLTYGAFGQDREEKIQEKLSPLGRAYAEAQEIDERGQALAEQINSGRIQGYDLMGAKHKLKKLEEEYSQVAGIFEGHPITGEYNQELIDKAAQEVDDVTKYFEDITSEGQKERAAGLAPKTSKVMETIIDKPGKAFIDFTLGPNWKENLPEQQNQFYKKRYPRNPRELGQHLSYDPDIPMFAEGGIVGLLKK